MKRTCENCDYWHRYAAGGSGECRRHAPAPMYSMTNDKPGPIWWPQTLKGFWCGDYAERISERLTGVEVPDDSYVTMWNRALLEAKFPFSKNPPRKNRKKSLKEKQDVNKAETE